MGARGRPRPCRDHTGAEFPSVTAMCEAWGVGRPVLAERLKRGWALKDALERPTAGPGRPCRDHTGRGFPSVAEMCEAWGVSRQLFDRRRAAGWPLADALGRPPEDGASKPCRDHTGAEFPSVTAMCEAWGVPRTLYYERLRQGWGEGCALAGTALLAEPCADPRGRRWESAGRMCRAWGADQCAYVAARLGGMGPAEALASCAEPVRDHTGAEFPGVAEMCRAWGTTPAAYRRALRRGLCQAQALGGRAGGAGGDSDGHDMDGDEMAVPQITDEGRRLALGKAVEARRRVGEAKRALACGEMSAGEVIGSDEPALRRMKVSDLIAACPGYGPKRAERAMAEIGISPSRRVGGLGPRQAERLRDLLG